MSPRHSGSASQCDLFSLPVVVAEEFMTPGGSDTSSTTAGMATPAGDTPKTNLSEAELGFLRAVVKNPGQPSSTYPKLARIGTKKAIQIRKRLIELGYLREHQLQTGKKGRAAIVLEPQEKAIPLVGKGGGS